MKTYLKYIVSGHSQHLDNLGLHRIFFKRTFTAILIFLSFPISATCQPRLILVRMICFHISETKTLLSFIFLMSDRVVAYRFVALFWILLFDLRGTPDTSQGHSLGYKKSDYAFFSVSHTYRFLLDGVFLCKKLFRFLYFILAVCGMLLGELFFLLSILSSFSPLPSCRYYSKCT